MKLPKLCFFGYISYISIGLIIFTINTVVSQRRITDFLELLWIPNLILFGIIIFIGTLSFFLKKLTSYTKVIVIIFSLFITFIQMVCLFIISFVLAMLIVSPVLHRLGFYVAMP